MAQMYEVCTKFPFYSNLEIGLNQQGLLFTHEGMFQSKGALLMK